jgi:hypothetical protein
MPKMETGQGLGRDIIPMFPIEWRPVGHHPLETRRVLKNVMSAGRTRQNPKKERSLYLINAHFEEDFNTVLSSAIVFQYPF